MSNYDVTPMASNRSAKSTQALRAVAKFGAGSNNIHEDDEKLHHHVENLYTSTCDGVEHVGARRTEHALHDFNAATYASGETVGSKSLLKGFKSNYLLDLNLESPLILSPTGTVSTTFSPGAGSDIWDSPQTPSHQLGRTSWIEVSTPLSSLTAYDVPAEQTPIPKVPESLLTKAVKNAVATDTVAAWIAHPRSEEDERKEELQGEGNVQLKRLFRSLTKEFQAIADANAVAAQEYYNRKPEFDFSISSESISPAPSRQHSNVKTKIGSGSDSTQLQLKIETTEAKVEANIIPRSRTSPKNLQKVLEHIVPLEIHSRLRERPHQCIASLVRRPHERCPAKGPSGSVDGILKMIAKCNTDTDCTEFLGQIKRLVQAVMCGTHQNVALSAPRMKVLRDTVSNLSHLSNENRSDFRAWISTIWNGNLSEDVQESTDHTPSKPAAPSTINANAAVVTVTLSYTPKFSSYQPKWSKKLCVPKALSKVIAKPLKPSDLNDGFIYIFWDKEYFGKVKIGLTTNLDRRLEQWNRECKRTHSYHAASKRGELTKIPHASRIERLIHIELKEFRKKRVCEVCEKTHREWFEVEEALAVKVFQKWQKWITQKPYALDVRSGTWEIRPDMLDTVPQICEPVLPDLTQQTRRHNGAGTKSRRRSKRKTM